MPEQNYKLGNSARIWIYFYKQEWALSKKKQLTSDFFSVPYTLKDQNKTIPLS